MCVSQVTQQVLAISSGRQATVGGKSWFPSVAEKKTHASELKDETKNGGRHIRVRSLLIVVRLEGTLLDLNVIQTPRGDSHETGNNEQVEPYLLEKRK